MSQWASAVNAFCSKARSASCKAIEKHLIHGAASKCKLNGLRFFHVYITIILDLDITVTPLQCRVYNYYKAEYEDTFSYFYLMLQIIRNLMTSSCVCGRTVSLNKVKVTWNTWKPHTFHLLNNWTYKAGLGLFSYVQKQENTTKWGIRGHCNAETGHWGNKTLSRDSNYKIRNMWVRRMVPFQSGSTLKIKQSEMKKGIQFQFLTCLYRGWSNTAFTLNTSVFLSRCQTRGATTTEDVGKNAFRKPESPRT